MTFRERLLFLLGHKESGARIVTTLNQIGKPVSTPANYESFARDGYSKNMIVYAAIAKIATAAKGIEWCLYSTKKTANGKKTELETHPLLDLLAKPNPLQAQASFFESVVAFKLIAGNSYIEANRGLSGTGPVLELWPVRPDKMRVIGGKNGYPAAYQFSYGGTDRQWLVDPIKLTSNILHWKSFNPLNDWYGLSALEAAMIALDQNNYGQKWNLALLQNSATPSGVLQTKSSENNPRGELTDEQYKRIKAEFETSYQGSKNAGRPLLIEGGLSWQSISLSPKEMDFLKSDEVTAIKLLMALGVPPEIMGLGQKTFNNYGEARLSFYEETVLPTMDDLRDSLNSWLVPQFGEGLYLDYDKDDIEALGVKKFAKMASLKDVTFLTVNEKREQCGYDEVEGGDELDKPSAPSFGGGIQPEDDDTEDPKPKPKPKPATDSVEVDPEDDGMDDDKGFGWKSINLLTKNEKAKSWKYQNARRKQLAHAFSKDVKADYDDLAQRLAQTAEGLAGKQTRVIEYALNRECSEWAQSDLKKTMSKHIRLALEDFGGMVLGEGKSLGYDREGKANRKFDDFVKSYIAKHTATQISTINSTNENTIRRVVKQYVEDAIVDGDDTVNLSRRLQSKFGELSDSSSTRIARTEVGMASTNGAKEAVKSLNVPNMFKEWVSANDARVRDGDHGGPDHAMVNGQEVPLDEKFSVPPDTSMDGPGDPSAPADQVINCRCVLIFRSKN